MKLQEISKKCLQALDAIEAAEIASLSWGYVHASLTYDEVEKLLQKEIGSDFDIDDLLDELLDARLIFSFENGSEVLLGWDSQDCRALDFIGSKKNS